MARYVMAKLAKVAIKNKKVDLGAVQ